ncbi:MAG: exodeoxyribonuclease VII small subunit [Lachnospiraceae bacterium]|nr:exodeoxyribonuclease VII small subunit [Lachnospiraceae bacterium]MEE1342916.1 exodeoxyribonuclease VII small subunit [Lachnospiraceae bacterium]
MAAKSKKDSNVSMEEKMKQLEEVVKNLEQEETTLEEAMEYYKTGITLVKECEQALDQVEKQIIILQEDSV